MELRDLILKTRCCRSFDNSVKLDEKTLLSWVDYARITNSTRNMQAIKYKLITDKKDIEKMLKIIKFGSALTDRTLPPKGQEPTAFITLCIDKAIAGDNFTGFFVDVGICAETLMYLATNDGFGGCITGSGAPESIIKEFNLPSNVLPTVTIAFGKPNEKIVLCDIPENGKTTYFRDENNVHYVPKRKLKDVLL